MSKQVIVAIDEVLEGQAWRQPKSCGALFIAFPSKSAWNIPASGWHIDANYTSELSPPAGVKVHALCDIAPRSGPNNGKEPRFLVSGGVDTDVMWSGYRRLRSSLTPE